MSLTLGFADVGMVIETTSTSTWSTWTPVSEVTSSRMRRRTSSATACTDFGHLTAMVACTLAMPSSTCALTLAASSGLAWPTFMPSTRLGAAAAPETRVTA